MSYRYGYTGAPYNTNTTIDIVQRVLPVVHYTYPTPSHHEPKTTQNGTWASHSPWHHMHFDSRSHYLQPLLTGERSAGDARGCGARQRKAANEAKDDEGRRTAGTMT
jgi:hypothetical protein